MAKFGIGQPVRRVEDQRFLTGQGRYVDDIVLPGMLHACNVLSPHAHAKIKKVDVSKAKAAPGVLLVLTGADVVAEKIGALTSHLMPEDFGAPKGHRTFQPLHRQRPRPPCRRPRRLRRRRDADPGARRRRAGRGRLRAAEGGGQHRGRRQARRDQGVGRQSGRQQRLPPDVRQQGGDRRRLRQAKHVVKLRVENNRLSPVSMEPRVAIGDYDVATDEYHALQRHRRIRTARAWRSRTSSTCRRTSIRVVSPDVGGGFGLKGGFFPEDGLVVWAVAEASPPGEVGLDPQRSHAQRPSRPRDGLLRRACARRARQDSRRCAPSRCSRWAPISSARRSPPARSRSASCPPPTTSRPCTSCRRACSPTPRRAVPIAAPAARRPRISWSG